MATSDSGQKLTGTNQGYLRIDDINGRLVIHDGTTNRAIFGILPDGTIAIVISKPSEDVFEALNS